MALAFAASDFREPVSFGSRRLFAFLAELAGNVSPDLSRRRLGSLLSQS